MYAGAQVFLGVDLPWMGQRWLLLPTICWFALGVAIYRLSRADAGSRLDWALALAAAAVIGVVDKPVEAALAVAFFAVLHGAARGRWTWLEHPVLLWLGAISYTLYLLHENIGWALLRRFESWGLDVNVAILVTIALCAALAHALTTFVEQPAMRWIRARHRARISRPEATAVQG